jgi:putative tryptophan/tyrosine transport system substrate-binding protein
MMRWLNSIFATLGQAWGSEFRPRQTAAYVDRILNGANPADLPVFLPTKFELVINLTTAKTLGIEVPLGLMVRADELLD